METEVIPKRLKYTIFEFQSVFKPRKYKTENRIATSKVHRKIQELLILSFVSIPLHLVAEDN